MRYTAVIIQGDYYYTWNRSSIEKNLVRYLGLIDFVCSRVKKAAAKTNAKAYAPVKLLAFPEFFLQGFTIEADIKKYIEDIAITIPGKETEELGKKAKKYGIYICGAALEKLVGWGNLIFNCAFIIDPEGNVIHKYHKYFPTIHLFELSTSPHDIFDDYIKEFGNGKSLVQIFFPVTETEIGNIGTYICNDGNFPEVARCLMLNGAEILIRPTSYPTNITFGPNNLWEVQNRARAFENVAYVVAPNTGGRVVDEDAPHVEIFPRHAIPGDSMIVNFEGQIIGRTPYPGETICSAVIDLGALREKRSENLRNLPTFLRTEVFAEAYKESIYPPNLFKEILWTDPENIVHRMPSNLGIIERFYKKGIYKKP